MRSLRHWASKKMVLLEDFSCIAETRDRLIQKLTQFAYKGKQAYVSFIKVLRKLRRYQLRKYFFFLARYIKLITETIKFF